MTREYISQKIQSNQRVDDSTRSWCESLVSDIVSDFESRTCGNCKLYITRESSDGRYKQECCGLLGISVINKNFGCNKFERKTDG